MKDVSKYILRIGSSLYTMRQTLNSFKRQNNFESSRRVRCVQYSLSHVYDTFID